MASALFKKSWRDLSQKKARTFFTVATVALAVMGFSLFGINPMAEQAAQGQIESENLRNIMISVTDVELDEANVRDLEAIDNVEAVEPRVFHVTRMYIGERRNAALFVGIEDFEDQRVDKVARTSGSYPGHMEVLTDRSNPLNGIYDGKAGDTFEAIAHTGENVELRITGEGKSLVYSANTFGGIAVFYTSTATVRELGNLTGYNGIAFDCARSDKKALEETTEEIRDYLVAETTVVAFAQLPAQRSDEQWPASEFLGTITSMMTILTALAILCSVFLISNTMNTIITEQRREIAQMKAIGASKSQVFRSFLTTAFFMGAIGAAIGAVGGIVLSNLIMWTLGGRFGFDPTFVIYLPNVIFGLVLGIGAVIAASLPALLRSGKVTVREGLQSHGIAANYGEGALDRVLMRFKSLPRVMQMGLRNAARKKGRSAATMVQVALAVGLLLGLVAFGNSLTLATTSNWDHRTYDLAVFQAGSGGNMLTHDLGPMLEGLDGIDDTEPMIFTQFQMGEVPFQTYGYAPDTFAWDIEETMDKGRWFTGEEHANAERVMVVGPAISVRNDLDVGDTARVMTATGPEEFRVVGVTSSLMDNGQHIFAPIETLTDILEAGPMVSGFYITVDDRGDKDLIDRTATLVEDELVGAGYSVTTQVKYVAKQRNVDQNQALLALMLMISVVIILISMIGLISTLTMNILDRTKEIGMLRCIGSKSRDIRRMFSTEGVFIAFVGWVVGIPLGVFISWFISYLGTQIMDMEVPFTFDPLLIPYAGLIAILGTALIIQLPLMRATRFKPGDAIRYQ